MVSDFSNTNSKAPSKKASYLKNTAWMFCDYGVRFALNLFIIGLLARYLGPNDFGVYAYWMAIITIFGALAKLGLDSIVVKELVNQPNDETSIIAAAFWLKLIGCALGSMTLVVAFPYITTSLQDRNYVIILSVGLIFQTFDIVELYFQAKVQAKIVTACKIFNLLISSGIKITLILLGADLYWFILAFSFDVIVLACSYYYAWTRIKKIRFPHKADLATMKNLLKPAIPLIFSTLMIIGYTKIDQIMIGQILSVTEVGKYVAGVRIVEAFFIIPNIIAISIFPAMLSAKKISNTLYESRLIDLMSVLIALAISITVLLIIFKEYLVIATFGSAYLDAKGVIAVSAISLPFLYISVISARWYVIENLQKLLLLRSTSSLVLNVCLNYLLIPTCGIVGASIATLATYIFMAFVFDAFTVHTFVLFKMKLKSLALWRLAAKKLNYK